MEIAINNEVTCGETKKTELVFVCEVWSITSWQMSERRALEPVWENVVKLRLLGESTLRHECVNWTPN